MTDASKNQSDNSHSSSTALFTSNDIDRKSTILDTTTTDPWPWDVSRTVTECNVCTQFPEFAWSVQQLCQKLWPIGYEEIKLARLDGGSFNRIFSLTVNTSAVPRPVLSQVLPTGQDRKSRRKYVVDSNDEPTGAYILRVSRWDFSEIEPQMQILSYVRLHTDIPVPRILAYDTGADNDLELPYTLQKRIPGVPLNSLIKDLTFHQRMDLVNEIAAIIKKIQKIESPAAGKIGYPKGTNSTPDTPLDNLAVITPADSTTDGDESSEHKEADSTTEVADALQVLHFDLPVTSSDQDPYNDTISTIKLSLEGTSVVTFFNFQFTRQMLQGITYCHGDFVHTRFYHGLMRVALEMDEELDLGTDVFNFDHGDLEPRNIMVKISDYGSLHITGVLDWDLASFVPRVVSCLAPRWLWSPKVQKNSNEREDEQDPTDPEAKKLKEKFDDLMGDEYVEMAYGAQYPLIRRLFNLSVSGIVTSEHFAEAEAIIEDWEKMKALFPEDSEDSED